MPKEPKRGAKTEVLSMRMDPKTRFVLDFLARVRGQSISTVVERAIFEFANNTSVGDEFDGRRTWHDYWHVSEGVRTLMVTSDKRLYPTFEEEYRVFFAKAHWPFFYYTPRCIEHKEWSIEILWPRIDEFVDIWTKTKSNDYFAAGRAMRRALSDAGVAPPDWPTKTENTERNSSKSEETSVPPEDLDDEIPF